MLFLASAAAAIIPMFLYLVLIWWIDRYDREPFGMVLRNYAWGGLGAIVLAILGGLLLSQLISNFNLSEQNLDNVDTIIVAPFIEEITKGLFLFITVSDRRFDNLTDGIVYGGAIGLGFGMTENFLYFISYGTTLSDWLAIVIIRTLFSAVMHCVSTGTLGAFLGYAKFKGKTTRIILTITGLGVAMFIHFAWNFSVSMGSIAILGFIFLGFSVIILISVFIASLMEERKIIYRELIEEAEQGIIPSAHLVILNSSKRNKNGWVDESIRKLYIKAATTLAFRKLQFRNSKGISRNYYEQDIERYRNFIKDLQVDPRIT